MGAREEKGGGAGGVGPEEEGNVEECVKSIPTPLGYTGQTEETEKHGRLFDRLTKQ